MKDTQFYSCTYCYKEFEPKRRRVQKFCSNTCRSKAHHFKKTTNKSLTTLPTSTPKNVIIPKPEQINKPERISAAGIGNAALGTLAVNTAKALFTSEDNKPATKGDLKRLAAKINGRYHLVKNIPPRFDGALPYFDMDSKTIVYFWLKNN